MSECFFADTVGTDPADDGRRDVFLKNNKYLQVHTPVPSPNSTCHIGKVKTVKINLLVINHKAQYIYQKLISIFVMIEFQVQRLSNHTLKARTME